MICEHYKFSLEIVKLHFSANHQNHIKSRNKSPSYTFLIEMKRSKISGRQKFKNPQKAFSQPSRYKWISNGSLSCWTQSSVVLGCRYISLFSFEVCASDTALLVTERPHGRVVEREKNEKTSAKASRIFMCFVFVRVMEIDDDRLLGRMRILKKNVREHINFRSSPHSLAWDFGSILSLLFGNH